PFDQHSEGEEDLLPANQGRGGPFQKGGLRGANGPVDVRHGGEGDIGRSLAGGRVEHRAGPLRGAVRRLAPDPVRDQLAHGLSLLAPRAAIVSQNGWSRRGGIRLVRAIGGRTARDTARRPPTRLARMSTSRAAFASEGPTRRRPRRSPPVAGGSARSTPPRRWPPGSCC